VLRLDLENRLVQMGEFAPLPARPRYLRGYKWVPAILLRHVASGYTVGFEIARGAALPVTILEEAVRAQREHPDFAVVVLAKLDVAGEELVAYCKENQFGLSVFAGDSLTHVVAPRYGTARALPSLGAKGDGWIPAAIGKLANRLTRIRVAPIISQALPELMNANTRLGRALDVVETALTDIVDNQRERLVAPLPFYRLTELERLLRLSGPSRSEHIIHSFRVYVVGCVLLDHFWGFFQDSWGRYMGLKEAAIDDVWFLASMFHDCGYIRHPQIMAAAARALELPGASEEPRVESPPQLARPEYQRASEALAGLLAHLRRGRPGRCEFGLLGGRTEEVLRQSLMQWYESPDLYLHGPVGALDLAAEMIQAVRATSTDDKTDRKVNRAFLAAHVFPAAGAIALHDWQVWGKLKPLGLYPFKARYFPLAGLLIYADTWDDYRRRPDRPTTISGLQLEDRGATVHVEWGDADALARKEPEYALYREFVEWPREMRLDIQYGQGGNPQ